MSSRDLRRPDDRWDHRREARWGEWTWSSEYNSYCRHRTGADGQPEYEFNTQPGITGPTTTYASPPQPWSSIPAANQTEWGRQTQQPEPQQPRDNVAYLPPGALPSMHPSHASGVAAGSAPRAQHSSNEPPFPHSERERRSRRPRDARRPPDQRVEYFLPGEGIDREVISADICRYLNNDALVRPGRYRDPQTGHAQEGFYITASRPLTSTNIADLKADTQKWHEARRSRGEAYHHSQIHDSRQYYGPSNIYGANTGASSYSQQYPERAVVDSDPSFMNYPSMPPPGGSQQSERLPGSAMGHPLSEADRQYEQSLNYLVTGGSDPYYGNMQNPSVEERSTITQTAGSSHPRSATLPVFGEQSSMAEFSPIGDQDVVMDDVQNQDVVMDDARNHYPTAAAAHSSRARMTAAGEGERIKSPRSAKSGHAGSSKRQRTP